MVVSAYVSALWIFFSVLLFGTGVFFFYRYLNDKDKVKLMFAISFMFCSLIGLTIFVGDEETTSNIILQNAYTWSNIPLIFSILYVANAETFKIKNTERVFTVFLLVVICSAICSLLPWNVLLISKFILISVAIESIGVVLYLVLKKRRLSDAIFLLSLFVFAIAGFLQNHTARDMQSILLFFVAYILLAFVFYSSSKPTEGGISSIFALRKEYEQVQKKLNESESRYKKIFNSVNDELLVVDRFGRILDVNQRVKTIFGYEPEEVIGKRHTSAQSIHLKNRFFLPSMILKLLLKKESLDRIPVEARHRDGHLLHVELSATPILNNGKTEAILAMIHDQTEEYNIRQKLDESNRKLMIHLTQTPLGYIEWDEKFQVTDWNQAAERLFGYKKEEALGKTAYDLIVAPSTEKTIGAAFDSLLQQKGGTRSCNQNVTKHNKSLTCEWYNTPLVDAEGTVLGVASLIQDVTSQIQAEKKIKKQNVELKKLDSLKSNFINITSHEIRTPMTAMKGHVQLLAEEMLGPINDEQRDSLNVIIRNADRLDSLIQDILDTSRLESGTMKFLPEKTNITSMISDIAETMQTQADTKHISIELAVEAGIPDIIIDRYRVSQVFINLINNAIKFSYENSTIHIIAKNEEEELLFEVQDSGRGIPKDQQDKIFETFYQVESGADRSIGGTGLGLAISRGIILSHGGKIWVESKEGEGSSFKILLPKKPVEDLEGIFRRINVFDIDNKCPEDETRYVQAVEGVDSVIGP